MAAVDDLKARISAEFASHEDKVNRFRSETVQAHKDEVERLKTLEVSFAKLRGVWNPRLEALIEHFQGKVKVTPKISSANRQATFAFQSPVASVTMRLAAAPNSDVTKLVLTYDLDILPIFVQFEKHSEIEFPVDKIDEAAIGKWLEDRLVGFVKTYLSLSENEYYLKDHLVVDPVSNAQFPKFIAESTLERDGKTYYFISDETRREFDKQKPR